MSRDTCATCGQPMSVASRQVTGWICAQCDAGGKTLEEARANARNAALEEAAATIEQVASDSLLRSVAALIRKLKT